MLAGAGMEVHQDGFCQNNEPQNKAPTPAMCEQTPRSTSGVLVYSYGLLQDWARLLVRKRSLFFAHHFRSKTEHFPRQARDKHVGNVEKKRRLFLQAAKEPMNACHERYGKRRFRDAILY
jgi:hypothetical protein